jgi:hypothetical protein
MLRCNASQNVVIEHIGRSELRLRKQKTLAALVAGITPDNLHGLLDA